MKKPAQSAVEITTQRGLRATLLLLFIINFLNFFDRYIPAVVLEPIRQEFGLDDTMLGLMGTAFTLVYALAGLPLGRLSDKMKRTRILSGGVFVWSVFTAASGAAWNFTSFLLIRMGVGIGEASCAPAANSMIGDMYPPEKRARALGWFMLGLPLGSLASFAVVGYLAHRYGWRAPFYVAAAPGVLIALLVLFLPEPVRGATEAYRVDANATPDRPYRRIAAIPTLWWIIASGATVNFAAYSMATFLSALLVRYHHVNVAQAGVVSAIVFGVMGLIGLSGGGWLSDRAQKVFPGARLMLGAVCMIVAAVVLWFGLNGPVGHLASVVTLIALGWMLYYMYFVTVYPSVQDVVEPRLRGTAMAVYFFFQYVLGGGFGTVVTGALSDLFAADAMRAAGGTEMTDAFRAAGLQASLSLIVPTAILLTGLMLVIASHRIGRDAARVRREAAAATV